MASPPSLMSTPLDPQESDNSHVQNIYSHLNSLSTHQPAMVDYREQQQQQPPQYSPSIQQQFSSPQFQSQQIITEPPVSLSTGEYRMDQVPVEANIIGGMRPTPEDFHSLMNPTPNSGMAVFQPHRSPGVEEMYFPGEKSQPTTDWKQNTSLFLRAPIAVAIIIFLMNLPIFTDLLTRYATWMYLSSGEISIWGLLVKSLIGAFMFAIYQMGLTLFENK